MRFQELVALIAMCAITALPATGAQSRTSVTGDRNSGYNARQIFEGVELHRGPVANLVDGIGIATTWPRGRQYDIAAVHLERAISSVDPGFFNAYASDVTSGDPGRVSNAIARAQADFVRVTRSTLLKSAAYSDRSDIVALRERTNGYGQIVVTLTDAVGVSVTVVVFILTWDSGPIPLAEPKSKLAAQGYARDRAIAALAMRLYGLRQGAS